MAKTLQHQCSTAGDYNQNDNNYITDNNMYDVDNRVKSFDQWDGINNLSKNKQDLEIMKQQLGSAGFYFNDDISKVKCFSCGYVLNLKKGESPTAKHYLEKPQCHFLTSIRHDSPKMLTYLSYNKRLLTFRSWPTALKQKPEDMANAGLIYTGVADKVQCFYCGGTLSNWEENDDPFMEHAYWIPTCQFMIQTKGIDYTEKIDDIRKKHMEEHRRPLIEEKLDYEPTSTFVDKSKCSVCYENLKSVCFDPCGHFAVCGFCAFNSTKCPVCRTEIKDFTKVN